MLWAYQLLLLIFLDKTVAIQYSDPPLGSVTPSSRLATSILQVYRISKSKKKVLSVLYQKVVNGDHKALYFSFSEVSTERFETIQKRRAELGYRNLDTRGDVHPDSRLKSPYRENSWQSRQSSKEVAAIAARNISRSDGCERMLDEADSNPPDYQYP
ncbi:hypothetical protein V8E54_006294 [Elaphomyces granulatus]